MEQETLRGELLKRGINLTDKDIAFWDSVFSNFYPCEIKVDTDWWGKPIDEITFISSEQYFMWLKAMWFDDEETAEKILQAKTPARAKRLGRQVKGFDDEEWTGKPREAAMWNAVLAKFSQNEDLKDIITAEEFNGKQFVEGSPYDKIWGVGIMWDDPKIADEKNWDGLNLLGKTLDNVRMQLLSDEKD